MTCPAPDRVRAAATLVARRPLIRDAATRRRLTRAATARTAGRPVAPVWLSTTQVARLLHVPAHRVQDACRDGRLPAIRTHPRGPWRIRADRLTALTP